MLWIINAIREGIWNFFADLANDIINEALNLIVEMILKTSELNTYFDIKPYVEYAQYMAAALLTLAVAWEGFKQLSGGMIPEEEKSLETYIMQTTWAGFLIYFLPKSVTLIFLRANNAIIWLIRSVGVEINVDKFISPFGVLNDISNLGAFTIMILLILSISFMVLGVVAGIRHIELLITTVIAPFVAISAVRKGEAIQIWVMETTAIVFTQAIHFLLLQFLVVIMTNVSGVMMVILSVSAIVIMLRGPQQLRKYLYSSGAASASLQAVGQMSRFAAMKYMLVK